VNGLSTANESLNVNSGAIMKANSSKGMMEEICKGLFILACLCSGVGTLPTIAFLIYMSMQEDKPAKAPKASENWTNDY
jgi:hypothetical protein